MLPSQTGCEPTEPAIASQPLDDPVGRRSSCTNIDRWLQMIEERFGDAASTQVAQTAAQALEILAREPIDVVLTEYRLPDADGLGLVASITARHPEVATILVTSQGSETVAANALKFGARDYLVKSELERPRLHRSILQAASKASLDREQAWTASAARAIAARNGPFRSLAVARHDGDVHAAGSFVSATERCGRAGRTEGRDRNGHC